ncbi:MAG: right-handed parallel beta-helix repeat-containing protein [Sedimentisphaerales bacterium]|nr:right-handed parallel beta-helix repeat-containing protein [Sedimentisphaerales bacterium]
MAHDILQLRFVFKVSVEFVLLLVSSLGADTILVPAEQPTIQDAINVAGNGDIIQVDPNTYYEAIDLLGKAVHLRSVSPYPEDTIIDGTGHFHVIQCVNGEEPNTVIAGFTITGGHAHGEVAPDDRGGGMLNMDSSPTLANCIFIDNSADTFGGGMYSSGGSPTLIECKFISNSVIGDLGIYGPYSGGGMYNDHSDPELTDCWFTENWVEGYLCYGGGIHNEDSDTILSNCTFSGNWADGYYAHGGGLDEYSCDSVLSDCTFTGNWATYTGGGMHSEDGSPELIHCTLSDNIAAFGGGMYNDSYHDPMGGNRSTLMDCVFEGNSSTSEGGGLYNIYCDSHLTDCTFVDNSAYGYGGGILNDRSSATVIDCTFTGNSTLYQAGGGFCNLAYSDADLVGCVFTGNSAHYHGGGLYNKGTSRVVNCTFQSNSNFEYTYSCGGGIADQYGHLTIVNSVFRSNSAGYGGGLFNQNSASVDVINCTFLGNAATYEGDGGGIYNRECDPVITNCIIWGSIGDEIYNYYDTADPNVTYSCVQGSYPGVGNISSNPGFSGFDVHIESPSPCIDAGNNDALPPDIVDVDGDEDTSEIIPYDRGFNVRRADDPVVDPDTGNPGTIGPPVVDMGAYELSVIYVDDNAPAGGDGGSWATAYRYLQDAIYASGDPLSNRGEIHVGGGTYYPDQSEGGYVTPTDREASFVLQNNLAIRGGYRGWGGGGSPNDRDIEAFECILSGDYANNDDPCDPCSRDENSYHIVIGSDTDASALLEGFTITAGHANSTNEHRYGGGIYNKNGGPTILYCNFVNNRAIYRGGGMYNYESNPIISHCMFIGNIASSDGGIENLYSKVVVDSCIFNGNIAAYFPGKGGIGFAFSTGTVTNCSFSGNRGGGLYGWNSDVTVTNCTFSGNFYPGHVGGLTIVLDSSLTMTNCVFWGNSESSYQISVWDEMDPTITYCIFQDTWIYCDDPNDHNLCLDPIWGPLFMRDSDDGGDGWGDDPNTPEDESANDDFGDLRLRPGSLCIDGGYNDADTDGQTPEMDPLPDTDLAGHDRIVDGDCDEDAIVDVGAYEFDLAFLGDCSGDCVINLVDFGILAGWWLDSPCDGGNNWCDKADINTGGDVTLDDLRIMARNWLAAVP